MPQLRMIQAKPRTGREEFCSGGHRLGFNLVDLWRWSSSDLVSNASRGILAEFLVCKALGLKEDEIRREWDAYDFRTSEGIKIEVKSAAYIQSWNQKDFSTISFRVKPRRAWDAETNILAEEPSRSADVYVLALLKHKDQATIDPMNLD